MDRRLSYEEWREADRRAMQASRDVFGGAAPEDAPRYAPTGHPLNEPLPATGDPAYDAEKPLRQVHSRAARDVAGFDSRTLDDIRRALDEGREPQLPPGWTMTTARKDEDGLR